MPIKEIGFFGPTSTFDHFNPKRPILTKFTLINYILTKVMLINLSEIIYDHFNQKRHIFTKFTIINYIFDQSYVNKPEIIYETV